MFTEKSIVVQAWVRKIKQGAVSYDDVPVLSNLRDVVRDILDVNKTKGDDKDVY